MAREIWVGDIISVTLEDGCLHYAFRSGGEEIHIRCSLNTHHKIARLVDQVLAEMRQAEVVPIRE